MLVENVLHVYIVALQKGIRIIYEFYKLSSEYYFFGSVLFHPFISARHCSYLPSRKWLSSFLHQFSRSLHNFLKVALKKYYFNLRNRLFQSIIRIFKFKFF